MRKLLAGFYIMSALLSAQTVHYDKADEKKEVVSYGKSETNEKNISKPNHPNNTLYEQKAQKVRQSTH
ncbi:MAG TPA: hypothetical protein CFH84_07255 [Sulfurimonas sp. UBA12504]|nr:MAG: hypothetical protein A2019_05320 [Sulfurimonas sp. GWF2_37_8]DAB29838.1 MAG TPA: hypothetical protein CFH84_07255 [Sulfurimonas sp. UBA12504]